MAQALELNLAALIQLVNRATGGHLDADKLIIGGDRQTLGQLIKALDKRAPSDQATAEALQAALDARNYLAHKFFLRNTFAFEKKAAYDSALAALKERKKQIITATLISQAFVQGYCEHLGVSLSDVLIEQDS